MSASSRGVGKAPRRIVKVQYALNSTDAFALLRAGSATQLAGSKRPATTPVRSQPSDTVSTKKRRALTPEQQALLDAIPEGKKRREYFDQTQKSTGSVMLLLTRITFSFMLPFANVQLGVFINR